MLLININTIILSKLIANWIQQCIKRIIHCDELEFIPRMQVWFNICKLINAICYIKKNVEWKLISSSQMQKKYLKNSATICDKNLQHNGYRRNVPYYNKVSEKAMAPHSSTLAWKIPWTEEPGRLQFMGSRRIRHDWVTSLSLFTFMHWRRKWQPTPVFLPGESQGWGCTESDTTEVT